MHLRDNEGVLPVFLVLLMASTYLGLGEYYIAAVIVVIIMLSKYRVLTLKKNPLLVFALYYLAVSIVGIITCYVEVKNLLELILKYFALPYIVFYSVPERIDKRLRMYGIIKLLIWGACVYGVIESFLRYNLLSEYVIIEGKAWMMAMNHLSNYQPCSLFLHYNYYGCAIVLGIIINKAIPYKSKLINAIYNVVLIGQLLVCQSRICWISGLILATAWLIGSKRITNKAVRRAGVFMIIILIIVVFNPSVFLQFKNFVSSRFARLWVYGFQDGSLGQRLGTLMNWPDYFNNNTLLGVVGSGYQSVTVKFLKEYSYFKGYSTVDCEYTVYLVETGIIGMLIFISGIIRFFYGGARGVNNNIFWNISKYGIIATLVQFATLDLASNNIIWSLVMLILFSIKPIKQYNYPIINCEVE